MQAIILTDDTHGYRKILGTCLCRMLNQAGITTDLEQQGYRYLNPCERGGRSLRESCQRGRWNLLFLKFLWRLRKYDLLVLVSHVPEAYLRNRFVRLGLIRRCLPSLPIINYDLVYMPTCNGHAEKLLNDQNVPRGKLGHYGLDRYDWYLNISEVSENPMPPGFHPYTQVGCHMDDGTLYPEQQSFTALLDFDVPAHKKERAIQIEALQELNIPFTVLQGRYPMEEIRSIYRKSSLFFLSKRESFGLAISEVQACGAYVISPYREWFPAHWIKADVHQVEADGISPNFIVYENDKRRLVDELARIRKTYSSATVVRQFKEHQGTFFYGNPAKMNEFVEGVRSGRIHSRSHCSYPSIDKVVRMLRENAGKMAKAPTTGSGNASF